MRSQVGDFNEDTNRCGRAGVVYQPASEECEIKSSQAAVLIKINNKHKKEAECLGRLS